VNVLGPSEPLPNAERALIDPAKLHDYLLSSSHPIGRFKARFFAGLGFVALDWQLLDEAFRTQHLTQPAVLIETTEYGRKYRIRAILKGPNARSALVESIWIIRIGEIAPRLVTAYPGVEI
jgi:hypothetical protein